MLIKLPHPKPASAANVLQAFTDKLLSIAVPMRQSMTFYQGREMARHKELAKATGIAVYFCGPHSAWQRGSNENMNGLVRQYLSKTTDLSIYSQEQLDAIADEIKKPAQEGPERTITFGGLQGAPVELAPTLHLHPLTPRV